MNMIDKQLKAKAEAPGVSLSELWTSILRKKWIAFIIAMSFFAIATVSSFLITPTYTALGQILIEREPNILSFEDVLQIEAFNDDYFQTQYRLLQSRALVGSTIDRLKLTGDETFVKAVINKERTLNGDFMADPLVRSRLINSFLSRLSIQPVLKTRLVQASFSDQNPRFAALILNNLFDSYIEMNIQKRYQATEQATDFLSEQIKNISAEIEAHEKQLQQYGKEKNIIALSRSENTVIEKLSELNRALTDAQIERINKETYYNEIRVATPDYIPSALNNSLIQRLSEEYSRLYRDFARRSERFLPDFPEIQSLKAELDQAKKALEDETQATINRAYTDFQAALSRVQALTAIFNRQRSEAFQLNSNAIEYNSLLIQIQNEKNLLESLMKRKSETDVTARLRGLRTSNIWIVDKAEIPLAPSSPKKGKNMILGLMLGILTGLGLAFLLDRLDNTVRDSNDIKKYADVPVLGMVPTFSYQEEKKDDENASTAEKEEAQREGFPAWALLRLRKQKRMKDSRTPVDLMVHFYPDSPVAECYRSIRTTLLLTPAYKNLQTLAITSPLPQDGKTVMACNLATVLSQTGKRVLLIDADLRKPRLHEVFCVKNLNGLTKYLTTDVPWEDLPRATPIPGLFLINSGPIPPNPLELLGSKKAFSLIRQLKKDFDFVLIDTPPILAVSDALVLGAQLDGEILVVRSGQTPRQALKQGQEKMRDHNINLLGVIINDIQISQYDEYSFYSYNEYRKSLS